MRQNVSDSKDTAPDTERVNLRFETVELTSLLSVQALKQQLLSNTPKLDAIILNAGYGAFTGINWPLAIWGTLTDWVQATTWPKYKLSGKGYVTNPQIPSTASTSNSSVNGDGAVGESSESEPPLGAVFCANVFGHYLLCHGLAPLLSNHPVSRGEQGRIIWVSSLEATSEAFSFSDFQGIESPKSYESSKRLTDILALTSNLPSTSHWVDPYLGAPASNVNGGTESATKPKMYVTQPGICSTGIVSLPLILYYLMTSAFYISRLLGSPWHTTRAYTGACAPVWLALSAQSQLDNLEKNGGPGKWGSAADITGAERVMRTEVEGWGYGGKVGDVGGKSKGRRRGAKDLTSEAREEFEVLGRQCWEAMEELRDQWEKRLSGVVGAEGY